MFSSTRTLSLAKRNRKIKTKINRFITRHIKNSRPGRLMMAQLLKIMVCFLFSPMKKKKTVGELSLKTLVESYHFLNLAYFVMMAHMKLEVKGKHCHAELMKQPYQLSRKICNFFKENASVVTNCFVAGPFNKTLIPFQCTWISQKETLQSLRIISLLLWSMNLVYRPKHLWLDRKQCFNLVSGHSN